MCVKGDVIDDWLGGQSSKMPPRLGSPASLSSLSSFSSDEVVRHLAIFGPLGNDGEGQLNGLGVCVQ